MSHQFPKQNWTKDKETNKQKTKETKNKQKQTTTTTKNTSQVEALNFCTVRHIPSKHGQLQE